MLCLSPHVWSLFLFFYWTGSCIVPGTSSTWTCLCLSSWEPFLSSSKTACCTPKRTATTVSYTLWVTHTHTHSEKQPASSFQCCSPAFLFLCSWSVEPWWFFSTTASSPTTSGSSSRVCTSSLCWWRPSSLRGGISTGTSSLAGVRRGHTHAGRWIRALWSPWC